MNLANSSRLASPGRAGGQPTQQDTQQDTNPPLEPKNSESNGTEQLTAVPTPKELITEEDDTPTPGERTPVHFSVHVLIAHLGQSAHREEKSEPPPVKPIDFADTNHHRHDPGDRPNT